MFEAHVLHLLRRYLGEYVHGLSAEALRISVWKGDVVLKDLKLKVDREKLFESKLQQIEETEAATLEAMSKSKLGSPPSGNSWLGSLIATIIGNLKISTSNVHVRDEDSISNPGHPFCSGVTLAKLAAVTMDEQGNETFNTSGALDKLRKVSLVFYYLGSSFLQECSSVERYLFNFLDCFDLCQYYAI